MSKHREEGIAKENRNMLNGWFVSWIGIGYVFWFALVWVSVRFRVKLG